MTLFLPRHPSARSARTGVVFGIAVLVLIAYAVPFFGLLASLCLPFVTHTSRRHLWPEASNTYSIVWSLLAWAGLWLPGLVDFFTPAFDAAGMEVSTTWLIIPLCAQTGLSAVLVPALAAAVTCLAGLLGAVVTRRGWSWVVASWVAPWVHYLVLSQLPHEFFC
ncbi:MAG: hypothetical protein H0V07_12185 [Propionibacteriales bacterium]|nr:hypothetical protein [Propionibacteriales bacterium]